MFCCSLRLSTSTMVLVTTEVLWTCLSQIVDYQISRGRLKVVDKPADVFRVAFIERKHNRRMVNFKKLIDKCQRWQLPKGTKYSQVECRAINLDDSEEFLENLSRLRTIDALVSTA